MNKAFADLEILLIEPRSFQRAVMLRLLESLGLQHLRAFSSSEEALAMIAEQVPDAVICDLQMKDGDGLAVVREIAQRAPQAGVILSSELAGSMRVTVEKMVQAYGARLAIMLTKPVEVSELREALLRVAEPDSRSAARPVLPDHQIRDALDQRSFIAHYEPKIEIATGRARSVEALARLRLDGQLVPPASFVPRIEALGWMEPLTLNVLHAALDDLRHWDSLGVTLKAAVNVPPSLLTDAAFPERFHRVVRAGSVSPQRLTLEITETGSVSGQGSMLESLARLRLYGYELSIDDFGTGHSSLQQLAQVPFSELKIDREFVSGAPSRDEMRAVVESSVELARRLKLRVCAEGVDSVEAMGILWDLKADLLQGWLFSRPLPADELLPWIAAFEGEERLEKLYLSS